MPAAVHQFVPSFARGDAIGDHTLALQALLRAAGCDSEIFAEEWHPNARGLAHDYRDADEVLARDDVVVLYHASTASAMAAHLVRRVPDLVVDYHNITEARFFERWEPVAAARAREARDQLATLAPVTHHAVAHSKYSERELHALGFESTSVIPLLLDFAALGREPDAATVARLAETRATEGTRWIFIGRVAPNKCIQDVIAAFAVYRHAVDTRARLTFVGGMMSMRYRRALDDFAVELGVDDAVVFTDSVALPVLLAHLRAADVFVSLSEHEGFFVPAVEAMHTGVPVIAFASTAVPETVAGGGVLLGDKDPLVVAAAVDRVMRDDAVRDALIAAGRSRARAFGPDAVAPRWRDLLISSSSPVSGAGAGAN